MTGSASPRRVLLVDDSPGDAFLTRAFLAGSDVEHVATFAEALAAVADRSFDVALLDMHLPDGAGPSLVDRLKHRAPRLPIIVLTGSTEPDGSALSGLDHGAQGWLSKEGLGKDQLHRTIEDAIRQKAAEQKRE